jgi:hypothetical protein
VPSIPKFRVNREAELEALFQRADEQYEKGNYKSAFRLCLAPAKGGSWRGQLALGNFYMNGFGVKPNRDLALYWTRRAYRQGCGAAAYNIGTLYRDEQKFNRARAWFERAMRLNDGDANLEIAKIYLQKNDRKKAILYLKQTLKADRNSVLEESREEAQQLLKQLTS